MPIKRCETAECNNPLSKLTRSTLCKSCLRKSRRNSAKIECGNFSVCGNMMGPHGKTRLCRSCGARERIKIFNADPEFVKRSRERMKKMNSDPEFAKRNRERMRKMNSDPEFIRLEKKRRSKRMKTLHSDPEFVNRANNGIKKYHAGRLAQKTSGLSPTELKLFSEYRLLKYKIDDAIFMARRDARKVRVSS